MSFPENLVDNDPSLAEDEVCSIVNSGQFWRFHVVWTDLIVLFVPIGRFKTQCFLLE